MTRRTMLTLAALLAAATGPSLPARAGESATPAAQAGDLPKDVSAYVERRMGCNHWMGEEPYDAARRREIDTTIKELACSRIDADERTLRRRRKGSPAIIKALDAAKDSEG